MLGSFRDIVIAMLAQIEGVWAVIADVSSTRSALMHKILLAAAVCSAFASSAFAQTHPPIGVASRSSVITAPTHTVSYKDRTQYDFDAEEVEGTVVQPDVDLITGRMKAHHQSLVRPRGSFQPELLQSVESL